MPTIDSNDKRASRHELAERMLHAFECGASKAITVRAPAKSGKSEFLHKDLMPAAQQRGFKTGHLSFKFRNSSPEAQVCRCLADMIGKQPRSGFDGLNSLRDQFQELMKSSDRFLLCLDDVDELANRTEHTSFMYTLRTLLEQNQQQIMVVFTGSDRRKLRSIFSDASAPFYKSSAFVDLP